MNLINEAISRTRREFLTTTASGLGMMGVCHWREHHHQTS